jgi:RNA-binding protein
MESLRGAQRRYLRGLAHGLDPVVQIGQKGLTDGVVGEVDRALDSHELIKVRIAGERGERDTIALELATRTQSVLAGQIGGIAILYRQQPDPERRKIELPR